MYSLAAISSLESCIAIFALYYYHDSNFTNLLPKYSVPKYMTGIWGPILAWPAAILATRASNTGSANTSIIGHLVMVSFEISFFQLH